MLATWYGVAQHEGRTIGDGGLSQHALQQHHEALVALVGPPAART